MSNGVSHDAQLMMRRTPWFAAGGSMLGVIIAILIIYWLCGCPCQVDTKQRDQPKATAVESR